jgi:hypothetical protein
MKRLKAIIRCVYHAFLPPFIERWKIGTVHYQQYDDGRQRESEYRLSYVGHMRLNLKAAYDLLIRPAQLSDEDKKFHKLKNGGE